MTKSAARSPTAPFLVRLALLVLLPIVALAIYLDGQRYDPDLMAPRPRHSDNLPSPTLLPDTLGGLRRAGQIRHFDKDNLYEYIDGHAEYFIGAGFRALAVAEYGDTGGGQPALVVNLYHMGTPLNAFGALVEEAGDQETVHIGTMGFRSGQGISFIHGPYYVQMSRFDPAIAVDVAGADLARGLAEQVKGPGLAFRFPDLGEVTSTRFVKESYHGLAFLNEVLERGFKRDGKEFPAFLVRGSPAQSGSLVAAFAAFFQEEEMPYRRIEHKGLIFFRVDDPYEGEWFFVPLDEGLLGAFTPLDQDLMAAIARFAQGNR